MENKKKSSFLMQGGILAAAGLLTRFIGMLYRIPLERTVGREGMGYYSNAYEIYNIALLVSCYSVPVAVSKLVADKDGKGEYVEDGGQHIQEDGTAEVCLVLFEHTSYKCNHFSAIFV